MRRRLRRTRQLTADLFVLAWIVLWVWLATWLHDLVMLLAGPVEVWRTPAAAWQTTSTAPVMGLATCRSSGTLWRPRWKRRIRGGPDRPGGRTTQEVVGTVALGLSVAFAAVPILVVLLIWLPVRLRFAQQAGAAAALRGDLELFALRALQNRPLQELARISPQPSSALRGNSAALAALAALEMRAVGLRPTVPTAPPQPP